MAFPSQAKTLAKSAGLSCQGQGTLKLVTSLSVLPKTFHFSALKAPHPGKLLHPRKMGTVGSVITAEVTGNSLTPAPRPQATCLPSPQQPEGPQTLAVNHRLVLTILSPRTVRPCVKSLDPICMVHRLPRGQAW